jgi:hypothetical protein
MTFEIVKVQLPLFSTAVADHVLVYNEDRSKWTEQNISDRTRKAIGEDVKAFFNAEFDESGVWIIADRVDDQPW